jgi:hypothetical protein
LQKQRIASPFSGKGPGGTACKLIEIEEEEEEEEEDVCVSVCVYHMCMYLCVRDIRVLTKIVEATASCNQSTDETLNTTCMEIFRPREGPEPTRSKSEGADAKSCKKKHKNSMSP